MIQKVKLTIIPSESRIKISKEDELIQLIRDIYKKENICINYKKAMFVLIFDNDEFAGYELHSVGFKNKCSFNLQQLFQPIILSNYRRFITVHNHTEQTIRPSKVDGFRYDTIRKVAMLFKFDYLDNIIISEKEFFSFKKWKK